MQAADPAQPPSGGSRVRLIGRLLVVSVGLGRLVAEQYAHCYAGGQTENNENRADYAEANLRGGLFVRRHAGHGLADDVGQSLHGETCFL